MSNILKSTKLDIALVKPYFKTICFTLLLPIVFAAINRSLLTGVSFAMCYLFHHRKKQHGSSVWYFTCS